MVKPWPTSTALSLPCGSLVTDDKDRQDPLWFHSLGWTLPWTSIQNVPHG